MVTSLPLDQADLFTEIKVAGVQLLLDNIGFFVQQLYFGKYVESNV